MDGDVRRLISSLNTEEEKGLRILQVNCRSIPNKIHESSTLVESFEADIVIGTESWLKSGIHSDKIFPTDFTVYRRDRDTRGGRVFI